MTWDPIQKYVFFCRTRNKFVHVTHPGKISIRLNVNWSSFRFAFPFAFHSLLFFLHFHFACLFILRFLSFCVCFHHICPFHFECPSFCVSFHFACSLNLRVLSFCVSFHFACPFTMPIPPSFTWGSWAYLCQSIAPCKKYHIYIHI